MCVISVRSRSRVKTSLDMITKLAGLNDHQPMIYKKEYISLPSAEESNHVIKTKNRIKTKNIKKIRAEKLQKKNVSSAFPACLQERRYDHDTRV